MCRSSNLSSGTVPDARLSANVPLLNATNSFSGADPNLAVTGGTIFGRITAQKAGVYGRQFQYSGRFIW